MKINKSVLAVAAIVIFSLAFTASYAYLKSRQNTNMLNKENMQNIENKDGQRRVSVDDMPGDKVVVKQNPVSFTGKLEKVNTGCFSDGECYVEVDGKHVTLIMGWSRDTVGKIMGGDNSVGGLEGFIGQNVQIYANKIDDKNYTLYGDENYYIAIK